MAIFKSGSVAGAMSGSLGGVTFSHNRGGAYARLRTIPTNPASAFQTAVRNYFAQLTSAWLNELTPAQRAAWETYAINVPVLNKLGDPVTLTGLNQYVRSNVPRLQAGLARVDNGPTTYTLASFTTPSITLPSGTEADVAFTNTDDWAGAVGGALMVFASRPQSPSINFFNGPYRFMDVVLGAGTPPTSPDTMLLPFIVASGNKVFFKARATNADGRLTSEVRLVATF